MDQQIQKVTSRPDYHRIYSDIIKLKYPEKERYCQHLLATQYLSALDIIQLNNIIFSDLGKESLIFNQKHRSYDESTILQILDYQKKNKLSNTQLANKLNMSRNTIAKYKKIYL